MAACMAKKADPAAWQCVWHSCRLATLVAGTMGVKSGLEKRSEKQPMCWYGCASDCAVTRPHPRHHSPSLPHASVNLTKNVTVKSADNAGIGALMDELAAAENSKAASASLKVVWLTVQPGQPAGAPP